MPNDLDVKAASLVATLVSFEFGDGPTIYRYARWASDVVYDGVTWTALPGLEITYGKQDGSTTDSPATLTMSSAMEPVASMKTVYPRVGVVIRELRPGTDSTARIMHRGRASRVRFNAKGNAGVAEVSVAGPKASLDATLSLVAGQFCNNALGDGAAGGFCGFDLAGHQEGGVIASINGAVINVPGLTTQSTADYWPFGEVLVDGLPLTIQSHQLGTGLLTLNSAPPPYWNGRTAAVFPGCDKTVPSCRRLGQEQWFNGLGIGIPAREVRAVP